MTEGGQGTVSLAQQVMHENTNQLDAQETQNTRDIKEDIQRGEVKKGKRSFFSRFKK